MPERSRFDLSEVRAEFPILGTRNYLNSCSLGALSLRAEGYMKEFLELWHTKGASAWYEHWLKRIELLRGRVGSFLGASSGETALLPSISAALSVVAESIDYSRRPKVVITELDFPTLAYQWAVKPEVEVVVLRSPDGIRIDPEQFEEVVDERTAVLATSHVFYATGYRQDLATLASIARRAGAVSLIDGYQGAGQISVDVKATGVDVYATGPLKWLCGGPGLAYLYVREERIRSWQPRITSWFATQQPFAFDLEGFRYRDDARRFELGTPALPTIHTSLGGQEIIDEVGITRIEARNRELTDRLVDGLAAAGFPPHIANPVHRTAIVLIPHEQAREAVAHLDDLGIIVDYRPGHVRISPHFYNTEEEVDQVVEALAAFKG